MLEWEESLFEFYQHYICAKDYGRPLGGDSFMNPNGSSLERQAVFKSYLPDHLGKTQAVCEEEEEEEAGTSSFAALKVSL